MLCPNTGFGRPVSQLISIEYILLKNSHSGITYCGPTMDLLWTYCGPTVV